MIKPLFYILCFFVTSLCSAQLLPIQQGEKWGFISLSGSIVIEPTFDWVSEFNGDFCIVKKMNRYGVIDKDGKTVIEIKYKNITFFAQNLLSLTNNDGKKRLYHLTKKHLWNNAYTSIYPITTELYAVTNEKRHFGVCDGYGEEIISLIYDTISSDKHFLVGLADSTHADYFNYSGKLLFKNLDYYTEWNETDTLILVKNNLINLYTPKTQQLLLENWSDAFAPLFNPLLSIQQNELWGVYNIKTQQTILAYQYAQISYPNNNYLIGSTKSRHDLFSRDGRLIYSSHDKILLINDDLLLTTSNDKQFTFHYLPTNSQGTTINSPVLSVQKNGLIIIQNNGKKGVINKRGQLLLAAKFDKIYCDEDRIKAVIDKHLTILSLSKNQSIRDKQTFTNYKSIEFKASPLNFNELRNSLGHPVPISNTRNNIRPVVAPTQFIINPIKQIVLPQTQETLTIYKQVIKGETSYGLAIIDGNNKKQKLTKADYWHIDLRDYYKGDAAKAILQGGRNCLIHYTGKITYSGKVLSHGKYSTKPFAFIGDFTDDLAPVNVDGALYKDQRRSQLETILTLDNVNIIQGLWGFYNRNGEQVVKAKFKKVTNFENKRAFVLSKGWGMISTTGDTIVKPIYESLQYLDKDKNLILSGIKKQLYGLASPEGTILTSTSYSKIKEYSGGYFQVQQNRLWGYLNQSGGEQIACQFTDSRPFGNNHLAAVKTKLRWGFIDTLGNWIIEPKYNNAESFDNGTAVVKNKNGYGVIDISGKWIIKPKYKKIIRAGDGLYWIKKGQKYGLTNSSGKWIMTPQFEVVFPFDRNGLAKVRSSGTFQAAENSTGLVNREGKFILKTKYRPTITYLNDSLLVFQEQLGVLFPTYRHGLVDINGHIILKPKFTRIFITSKNTLAIRSKGAFSVYQTSPFKFLFKCSAIKPGKSDYLVYKEKGKPGWIIKSEDNNITYQLQTTEYIYGSTNENKLILRKNGTYQLFDLLKRRFAEIKMTNIIANYNRHIVIKYDKKGFVKLIDDLEHLLINGDYNRIKKMKSGYYLLGQSWHYGIFDRLGNEITPSKADQIKYLDELNIIQIRIGNQLNYLDMKGNKIYTPIDK